MSTWARVWRFTVFSLLLTLKQRYQVHGRTIRHRNLYLDVRSDIEKFFCGGGVF